MSSNTGFKILPVRSKEDLDAAIELFRIYATWLEIDLSFQGFEAEMAAMPGKYAPSSGELLLARDADGRAIGCVGLRPLEFANDSEVCCEMKRLYVSPEGRGTGLGSALVAKVVEVARELGYQTMRLDTLPRMIGAIKLYKKAGFVEIEKYYENPMADTLYLGLSLIK